MLDKKLERAAWSGNWVGIDALSITQEMLIQRANKANTLFHIAADNNKLRKIPRELMTDDIWLQENASQETVLHLAAQGNEFHLVSKDILTERVLLLKDIHEWTVIDHICVNQSLRDIPRKGLTDKSLGDVNRYWGSCLTILVANLVNQKLGIKKEPPTKLFSDNINIVLSMLSEKSLKEHLDRKEVKESVYEKIKDLIHKELFKRKLIEKVKNTEHLEI